MSNQDKAKEVLAQFIAENKANDFAGIDRSAEAIEDRHKKMNVGGGKDKGDSEFGRELEQHVINGDITSAQSSKVLLALYGLA